MVHRIERDAIDQLIDLLRGRGHAVVGPTLRGAAVVLDEIYSTKDLPVGFTNEQAPGRYRLVELPVQSLFAYTVGADSWKQYLFPPILRVLTARKNGQDSGQGDGKELPASSIPNAEDQTRPYALFGVRSCDLHALQIQDKVFGGGAYKDPYYQRVRAHSFVVAVNCTLASGTCFCASMKTGPRVTSGFDLALTEVITERDHYFLAEIGSELGRGLLEEVKHRPAESPEVALGEELTENASRQMGRSVATEDIKEVLYQSAEHPRWDEVAKRCLTCANCTMVCPTCFCTTVEDHIDLTGTNAERLRKWDSCFTMDFSYIHGGSVRPSVRARYRHWLTHKLASWIDQFGTSGCVGCGRCITWCPVGIDITEEYQAIRETFLTNATSSAKEAHDGNA